MPTRVRRYFLIFLLVLASSVCLAGAGGTICSDYLKDLDVTDPSFETSASYDIDGNLLRLGTQTILFDKKTNLEIRVNSDDVDKWLQHSNWELRDQKHDQGSYKLFFSSPDGRNFFAEEIRRDLELSPDLWRGPMWENFVELMKNPAGAQRTTLVTGRGYAPEEIHQGFLIFKERGYINNVPPVKNIYPVMSYPGATWNGIPEAKAEVVEVLLDKIALHSNALHLGAPQGGQWIFSDDDQDNINAIKKLLDQKKDSRWPRLKVILINTGEDIGSAPRIMTWPSK